MAHERTELPLGPGVTALTGPNNTGKSAVVEALRCVATNPAPRSFIRHGAKEARVTVVMDDGTRIVWIRKKASAGYELWAPGAEKPEEFWKIRRRPPDEVLAALRLDVIELEGEKTVDVHIGNQREPVFLLNRPDSDAAAFFAASSESAHLLAMQNRLKARTQDAKRRERDLEERREAVEAALDALAPLPDISLGLDAARALETDAARLRAEIPALAALRQRLDETGRALERRRAAVAVCDALAGPPKIKEVAGLDRLIRQMGQVEAGLDQSRRAHGALAPVQAPPAPFDAVRLATLCNRCVHLDGALREAEARAARLADLHDAPALARTGPLAALLDGMRGLGRDVRRAGATCDRLRSVAEAPALADHAPLIALVADLRRLAGEGARAGTRLNELETALRKVEERIGRVVDELGQCPTCGANLNLASFLDHGRSHDA